MNRAPRLRVLSLLILLALVGVACAKQDGDGDEVRAFLDETGTEAHRFVYTERTPTGTETVVQGIVEDDFRSKARVAVDGEPVLERVVSDDLVAVRFSEPDELGRYIDKDVVSLVDTETDREGVDVFTALQSKRWVVDPGGAPPLLRSVDDLTENGRDPIFDASELLQRARDLTFLQAGGFVKYRETSVSPTYRADEDPFPAPEEGSGVDRYDLPQPRFPRRAQGLQLSVPGEANFRKFAVYVKDGKVIRVAEDVGLAPSVLDDFETYMIQLINESAPPDVRNGFRAAVDELEGQELGQFLLEGLNTLRDLQGDPRVRFRNATYELLDIGDPSIAVEVPEGDLIEGDLAVLLNLGVKPPVSEDESAEPSAGDGTDTVSDAPGVPTSTPSDRS